METQEIVSQIKAVLPKYTNAFTNNLTINSLTRSGNVVTVTRNLPHNLIVGDKVLINGAKTAIKIENLTSFGTYALAITTQQHNLTRFNTETEISGADQINYNGIKTLIWSPPIIKVVSITISENTATVITKTPHGLIQNISNLRFDIYGSHQDVYNQYNIQATSVINSTSFTYTVYGAEENAIPNMRSGTIEMNIVLNANTFMFEIPSEQTSPATGKIFQLSTYKEGYNGYKTIDTVPSPSTFTYNIDEQPLSPAQGSPIVQLNPCIEGFNSIFECTKHFQSQNATGTSQNWIYVILGDTNSSKNTRTRGDSLSYGESGISIREEAFQNVFIYIYLPYGANSSRNELSSANIRDLAYGFKPYIYKSLLGFRPSSNLSNQYYSQLLPINDGVEDFDGSTLIYRYSFQATTWVNTGDAVERDDVFAFREFDFDIIDNFGYDESVMSIQGRLDE